MSWFRYIKIDETLPSSNYKYPFLKRKIYFPNIKQDIQKDDWLFINIKNLKIDTFVNSQLNEVEDTRSFAVIYEDKAQDSIDFICVNSKIIGDLLYFQAAENHSKDVSLEKVYSIYYKTKKIKNIKVVQNSSNEEYQEVTEEESDFSLEANVDQNILTTVNIEDISYYSFSFLNQGIDWRDGKSRSFGARATGIFTGPSFTINCETGPDSGILKLNIISVKNEATPENIIIENNLLVDLFSTTKENKDVYSVSNLDYGEYIFEIICDKEKNALASDYNIKINNFSFSLDLFLEAENEEISPYLLTRTITGVL